ncbi:MAG: shikimate kinase [Candidatus Latescibacterota bacterium]|nr:MAG: shikimate kinase [Candidatus Latescibacterota bacterium]
MAALHAGGRALEPIVLIGFMGSGKSTLGRRLAEHFGFQLVDLDEHLEQTSRRSIRDIMAQEGEPAFRRLELECLRELVEARPERCVVATGGGIVESAEAAPLLRRLGRVIWLRADPQASVDRLTRTRRRRPLLDDPEEWRRRWVRREPLYRAAAHAVVRTHPETCDASFREIVRLLKAGDAR